MTIMIGVLCIYIYIYISHEYSSNCKLCSKIFLKSIRSEFQLLIEAIKDQPLCEMKNKILNLEDNHQNYIYQVFGSASWPPPYFVHLHNISFVVPNDFS